MSETNYNDVFESVLNKYVNNDKKLQEKLKNFYCMKFEELPQLFYKNGEVAESSVLAYLLLAGGKPDITLGFDGPDADNDIQTVLSLLDYNSFKEALYNLAIKYMVISYARALLAHPICYYADEELMDKLIKFSSHWKSATSGINAPAFKGFRSGIVKSKLRSAILFADKYGDLDWYARYHNTDVDTLRDKYMSDVGLDKEGIKCYNLGNQTVIAKLQKDFSFVFESENGKTSKSLPKKGADTELYEKAKADFDEIKKSIKKIVKNRKDRLFEDFLSGRSRESNDWKNAYLKNPLLRSVASLLVWSQENKTFTLTDAGAITSDGALYHITNADITVAHPIEMKNDDISAWQKYFANKGLKQPFEQIWEPVITPDTIEKERYADCMIPYYRFANQEKHGIFTENYDFGNDAIIEIADCKTVIQRIDWERHNPDMKHNFEIKEISFKKFTRRVNHIIAYFDRITVYGRIAKDDVSVERFLPQFTLAQFSDFIKIANENNATNVLAMLLEFKNKNFENYDPMEEFVL